MKKENTAKLLVMLLLATQILASCGDGKDPVETTANGVTDSTDATTGQTAKDPNDDDLPEGLNFGGKEYRVLTYKDGNLPTAATEWPNYIEVESESGDLVNDAAFKRNREVEERLGVTIKCTELSDNDVEGAIRKSVMAYDDAYELAVFFSGGQMLSLITDGILLDVNSTEYIDMTKPYYSQSIHETFRLGDENYLLAGKYPYPQFASVFMLFNKDLWNDYKLEDPYELVESGKWTLDKLSEIVKGKYSDLNGNSTRDARDFYGMTCFDIIYSYFYFAAGGSVVSMGNNGFEYNMNTERSISIVEKLVSLIESDATFEANPFDANEEYTNFYTGNSLLCLYVSTFHALRDIEFDFGILPLPKYDEAQENYRTYQTGGICAMPSTVSDTAFASAVTEALFSTAAKLMTDPFIEKFVQNKLLRDEGSQRMYKLLTETASYELTRQIDPTGGLVSSMKPIGDLIVARSTDVSSKWASIKDAVTKAYDDLYNDWMK